MKMKELVERLAPSMAHSAQAKLPGKVAYRLAKNIRAIQPELDAFNDARNKLMQELGKPSEDGQNYLFEGENGEIFTKEINSLLDMEVTITLMRVSLDELQTISLEPGHVANLMDTVIYEVEQPAVPTP